MGKTIGLTASDGFELGAYEVKPAGTPRGGLVVIQEIFGVNAHIRSVADGYAEDGYHVIAPALFDRAEPGIELDYDDAGRDKAIALMRSIPAEAALLDIAATVAALAPSGKVGLVGYCWGGSLAWFTACRLDGVAGTIGYYGGMIAKNLDEKPKVPVLLHFGEKDPSIPMSDIDKVREAVDPAMVQIFTYPAGHAFNREGTPVFHDHSAMLARMRTVKFLREQVG